MRDISAPAWRSRQLLIMNWSRQNNLSDIISMALGRGLEAQSPETQRIDCVLNSCVAHCCPPNWSHLKVVDGAIRYVHDV